MTPRVTASPATTITSNEITLCIYIWVCVYANVLNKAAGQGADIFVLFPIFVVISKADFSKFNFFLVSFII